MGQNRSARRPPKEFFIEAANGLLNCDRRGNLSFSRSGNGRGLFHADRYDGRDLEEETNDRDYFACLDISMDETHVCVVDREGVVIHEGKSA
jgi:hypothetical protein